MEENVEKDIAKGLMQDKRKDNLLIHFLLGKLKPQVRY